MCGIRAEKAKLLLFRYILPARIKKDPGFARDEVPRVRDRRTFYWFTVPYIFLVEGNEITAERRLEFIELLLERWRIAPASEEIHPPTIIQGVGIAVKSQRKEDLLHQLHLHRTRMGYLYIHMSCI